MAALRVLQDGDSMTLQQQAYTTTGVECAPIIRDIKVSDSIVTWFHHLSPHSPPLFQSCTLSFTPTLTLSQAHINYRCILHTYLSLSTNPSSSMVGKVVSGLIFLSSSHLRCSPKRRPHRQVAGTANVASQ